MVPLFLIVHEIDAVQHKAFDVRHCAKRMHRGLEIHQDCCDA